MLKHFKLTFQNNADLVEPGIDRTFLQLQDLIHNQNKSKFSKNGRLNMGKL
jgi:hypothetical protein